MSRLSLIKYFPELRCSTSTLLILSSSIAAILSLVEYCYQNIRVQSDLPCTIHRRIRLFLYEVTSRHTARHYNQKTDTLAIFHFLHHQKLREDLLSPHGRQKRT